MFFHRKPKLTKEQQNNVVKRILRNYNIHYIRFLNFDRDKKTGTYLLTIQVEEDANLKTTIGFNSLNRFDDSTSDIGLDPITAFDKLKRKDLMYIDTLEVSDVNIIYLGECFDNR